MSSPGKCESCIKGQNCDWSTATYVDFETLDKSTEDKSHVFSKMVRDKTVDQSIPFLTQGYWASKSDRLGVMLCGVQGKDKQCAGGDTSKNLCSNIREGMLCGLCPDGYQTLPDDGDCSKCESGVDGPVVTLLVVFFLLALWGMKRLANPSITERLTQLISVSAVGILIQFTQILGAFNQMKVDWGKAAGPLFDSLSITTFRLDLVKLQCVAPANVVATFLAKMIFPIACILCLIIVFTLDDFVIEKRNAGRLPEDWREQKKSKLFNTIGMLMVTFYISLALAAAQPFMCYAHPTGAAKSLALHPMTLCWNSDDHTSLVILAIIFSTIYSIGVFAWCGIQIMMYPKRILNDDVRFVGRNKYLFIRWNPESFWFSSVLLGRNIGIAAITAFVPYDNPEVQINLLQLVLLVTTYLQVVYQPWKAKWLNLLDTSTSLGMLVGLNFAAVGLVSGLSYGHSLFLAITIVLLIVVSLTLILWAGNEARKNAINYTYTICHYKGTGGATARLLQRLLGLVAGKERVFYDDFALVTAGDMFEAVKGSRTLILMFCAELLSKKTCVGQMVTAWKSKVKILPLVFEKSVKISEDTNATDVANTLSAYESLAPFGMSVDDCRSACQYVQTLPRLFCVNAFDAALGVVKFDETGVVPNLSADETGVQKKRSFKQSFSKMGEAFSGKIKGSEKFNDLLESQKQAVDDAGIVLCGDTGDYEGVSATFFLKMVLMPMVTQKIFADALDENLQVSTVKAMASCQLALIMVTNGMWKSASLGARVVYLKRLPERLVQPVIACKDFAFGSIDFFSTMIRSGRPLGQDMIDFGKKMGAVTEDMTNAGCESISTNEWTSALQSLFTVLTIPFEISYASVFSIEAQTRAVVIRYKLDSSGIGRRSMVGSPAVAQSTEEVIALVRSAKASSDITPEQAEAEAGLRQQIRRLRDENATLNYQLSKTTTEVEVAI